MKEEGGDFVVSEYDGGGLENDKLREMAKLQLLSW
jgi:hypothetical protein